MPLSIVDKKLSNKLIMLPTPETLVSDPPTFGAWTTVSSSTLSDNKAKYAYLSAFCEVEDSDTIHCEVNAYFRKTDSGLTNDDLTMRISSHIVSGSGGDEGHSSDMSQFFIELNNDEYDFDYYFEQIGAPDVAESHIELLGWGL